MNRWGWGALALCVAATVAVLLRARAGRSPLQDHAQTAPRSPARLFVYSAHDPEHASAAWSLDVFSMNLDGSAQKNLTRSQAADCDPALSPDGAWIAYSVLMAEEPDIAGIYVMRADGTEKRRVTPKAMITCSPSWSPDGRSIAYCRVIWSALEGGGFGYDSYLEVIDVKGGEPRRIGDGSNPDWSPDGKRLLFTNDDGSLCVMNPKGGDRRVLVENKSEEGGISGAWMPDGAALLATFTATSEVTLLNANGKNSRVLATDAGLSGTARPSADGKWVFYTRSGDMEHSISEVCRIELLDSKKKSTLVQGKAMTGAHGWMTIGFLGIGREEAAQATEPHGPTVEGVEDPTLISRLTGHLIRRGEEGGLVSIALPGLKRQPVLSRAPSTDDDSASIYYHAGPDESGRVVYVENHMAMPPAKGRFVLRTVNLDGTGARTLFERPGDALWDHAISENLALSPNGLCAYATNPGKAQMPGALLQTGKLEIFDLSKDRPQKLSLEICDQGFSWFPKGKQLAYVALVPKKDAPIPTQSSDGFGTEFSSWDRIPTVLLYEVATGKSRMLHIGWKPVVCADGKQLAVTDLQGRLRQIDVSSGTSQPLALPGFWGVVVAYPSPDLMLYWALPTAGQTQKYTRNNSPLVGPKQMLTIKAAVPNTKRFATVLSDVDPREQVSYGAAP